MADHQPGKLDINQAIAALKSLKALRNNVGTVFQSLTEGIGLQSGQDSKESKFVAELQQQLVAVQISVREFEEGINNVDSIQGPNQGPIQLGNSGYLNQDCTPDALNLYESLISSYRWTDNLAEYTSYATTLLSQNSLKRSTLIPNKRRRIQPTSQNVPPQTIDNVINTLSRSLADMKIEISRPYGSSTVVQITLGKIMKGIVVLKRLMVEWVVVKGSNEDLLAEDGKIDMWGESRYKVFRKVTENANAAMLHFYSPAYPELAIRSFLTWFHSFHSLFTSPCKKCGHHLHNLLPPTWRDLRNLDPYHEDCKP